MAYTADTVIREAEKWEGYLEKSKNGTDAQLIDKKWSPGSANITWFWTWLDRNNCLKGLQGDAWCDAFVDFCHAVVGGVEKARESLGGFSAYTPDSANRFKKNGRWIEANGVPARGDQIFFKNSQRIYHTGIVTKVTADTVYTIEGNTSSEAGVVENGGCVRAKSYSRSYSRIAGYGRPAYDKVAIRKPNKSLVREGQDMLNKAFATAIKASNGSLLEVNGEYDEPTRNACLAVWKYVANHQFKSTLTLSNHNFGATCKKVATNMAVKNGSEGVTVYLAEMILAAKGYYGGSLDAVAGSGVSDAIYEFQKDAVLRVDGILGPNGWEALFNE